jgi:hypothetical protein
MVNLDKQASTQNLKIQPSIKVDADSSDHKLCEPLYEEQCQVRGGSKSAWSM